MYWQLWNISDKYNFIIIKDGIQNGIHIRIWKNMKNVSFGVKITTGYSSFLFIKICQNEYGRRINSKSLCLYILNCNNTANYTFKI